MCRTMWAGHLRCVLRHLHVQDYVGRSMGMHTRYPGHDGHRPQPGSPLGRVIGIINEVRIVGLFLRQHSLESPVQYLRSV